MRASFRRFLRSRRGSTAIEYALVAALLAIAAISGARAVGVEVTDLYGNQATVIDDAWRSKQ